MGLYEIKSLGTAKETSNRMNSLHNGKVEKPLPAVLPTRNYIEYLKNCKMRCQQSLMIIKKCANNLKRQKKSGQQLFKKLSSIPSQHTNANTNYRFESLSHSGQNGHFNKNKRQQRLTRT